MAEIKRNIQIPSNSDLSESNYKNFLTQGYNLLKNIPLYLTSTEDINSLELAHLIPDVPESIIAIYVSINAAVCNKGVVSPFLVRHSHNNVFVFDNQVFTGDNDVPGGTVDAKKLIKDFKTPDKTWNSKWTYVMIQDQSRTIKSLWNEKGYIDMIPAKFEDFTMMSNTNTSQICFYIEPKAFNHPVNKNRPYIKAARDRGQKYASDFIVPEGISGETKGLEPLILNKGEKLYIATEDFSPCDHAWSNIHPNNGNYAVVNENSAVPLDLIYGKPQREPKYGAFLSPPKGSADLTTDLFYRRSRIVRRPIITGLFEG